MLRTLWNGAAGVTGQQIRLDTIANNLANINTSGYKKQRAGFADLLSREMGASGHPVSLAANSTAWQGSGTAVVAVPRIVTQGSGVETGRSLDLMIEGEGFFGVVNPAGEELYTRDGNFYLDSEGRLVNSSGFVLLEGIDLSLSLTDLAISASGMITARDDSGATIELGELKLYRFNSPGRLEAVGGNLFRATGASGTVTESAPGEDGAGMIRQGLLELSNVDAVEEMTELIEAQRAYQSSLRSVRAADEMWSMANNMRK